MRAVTSAPMSNLKVIIWSLTSIVASPPNGIDVLCILNIVTIVQ